MTTITAKIIEQGNGLPRDGETVYDNDTETLYRVLTTGAIFTGDVRGNYVHAQLEETGDDVIDLTDAEFAEVSDALVIDVRHEMTDDERAALIEVAQIDARGAIFEGATAPWGDAETVGDYGQWREDPKLIDLVNAMNDSTTLRREALTVYDRAFRAVIDECAPRKWTLTIEGEGEHPDTIVGDAEAAEGMADELAAEGDYDLEPGEETIVKYHLTNGLGERIDSSVVIVG